MCSFWTIILRVVRNRLATFEIGEVKGSNRVYPKRLTVLRFLSVTMIVLINTSPGFPKENHEQYIDIPGLVEELHSENIDRIVKALNAIKAMGYKGEIVPFIHDLWKTRKDKYPELPWEIIAKPIIQVNVVDILVQAHKNGKVTIDIHKAHQFLLSYIEDKDIDVARTAIGALGSFDDPEDVPTLLRIAREQQMGSFRASVVTLAYMCNPSAENALKKLQEGGLNKDRISYITEVRTKSQTFKDKTSWCQPRF